MNALWDHYWPAITLALVAGAIAGALGFRLASPMKRLSPELRRRRFAALAAGALVVVGAAALWHGPLGAGGRFAGQVERQARETLAAFEMAQVRSRLETAPLRRTLVLAGPADAFQRSELVRIMSTIPGVGTVRWADGPGARALPLIAEAMLAALAAFGLGLALSYFVELRRRSRAEWRW
ncbi:MAG TPA: hypothetical protein VFK58_01605 [Sphingomicrobium sp.]|nr:hypothetical protein [Sphingomicrobium sp.]